MPPDRIIPSNEEPLMSATIREELHQQIDRLPDDIVEKIANFTRLISPEPTRFQNILIGKMKTGKNFH